MTQFKDALAILSRYNEWRRGAEIAQPNAKQVGEAIDTAIKALRIADRLMGEPSEGMVLKARGEMNHFDNSSIAIYKAMRDQMLKEIEQEQHH